MKNNIFVIIALLFLISCSEKAYWDDTNKVNFIEGCNSSLNKMISKSNVNPFEKMNITIDELCACQLTKTMAQYPNGPTDKSIMKASIVENTKACMVEFKK